VVGGRVIAWYVYLYLLVIRHSAHGFKTTVLLPTLSDMYLPPSANCQIFPSAQPLPPSHRNHVLRKRVTIPPPLNLGSIEEERGASEYDCGILDLGAESPSASTPNFVENNAYVAQWAQAGIAVPRVPARRPSWRASSGKERSLKKESVDRDCGIW
jgi:hypothetical protein